MTHVTADVEENENSTKQTMKENKLRRRSDQHPPKKAVHTKIGGAATCYIAIAIAIVVWERAAPSSLQSNRDR